MADKGIEYVTNVQDIYRRGGANSIDVLVYDTEQVVLGSKDSSEGFPVAEFVPGIEKKSWIERYNEPGEFKFEAPIDAGMQHLIVPGSLVSHKDTVDVMVCESMEVEDREDEGTWVVTSGRDLKSLLEGYVVGGNRGPGPSIISNQYYSLGNDYIVQQLILMLIDHTILSPDPKDNFPWFTYGLQEDMWSVGLKQNRSMKMGKKLWDAVSELLEMAALGMRIVRPTEFSAPLAGQSSRFTGVIHDGNDVSRDVIFSYEAGDLKSANYLWTIKNRHTNAYFRGKWIEGRTLPSGLAAEDNPYDDDEGFGRSTLFVDVRDIDDWMETAPTDQLIIDNTWWLMKQRAQTELDSYNEITLITPEIDADAEHLYRRDYDIGDIVTVLGNYGVRGRKRVTEFAEFQDENGYSGEPTVSEIEKGTEQ